MSSYLCYGIAKEVVAEKNSRWKDYTDEEIIQDFFRTVDRNIYDVSSDEKYVYFNLKDELLAKYGIDLIKEQYEKYIEIKEKKEIIQKLEDINLKDNKEKLKIINEAHEEYLDNFQDIGLDAYSFFELRLVADITEMIVYHCSWKSYLEVYDEFLKYNRNLLMNSTDNPLKTALTVAI